MSRLTLRIMPAVLGAAVWVGPAASESWAQFGTTNPYARALQPPVAGPPVGAPPTGGLANVGPVNPFMGNLTNTNPWFGYGSGGFYGANPFPGLNYDPYGGYLRGAADVYMGQATFVRAREEAKLMRESTRQERIKTRKMMFDQWLDEQRRMPTPEQLRAKQVEQEVLRSVSAPQTTEISSGAPMNYLLAPLSELIDRDRTGTKAVPLDRDLVRRINVTRGDGHGNIGVLRNDGKLVIPTALSTLAPADDSRALLRDLETFSRAAYEQAASGGPVDGNVMKQLEDLSKRLNERLTRNINDYEFAEYNEGKRFLRSLDDAIVLLRQPDASRWVTGQYAAQRASVQELVKHMTGKGLRFAPANQGDEQAYAAVHQSMVSLYNTLRAGSGTATAAGTGGSVTSDR